ncbi:MAG TPA: glycoside hydrolase family 9 protein [Candidatus Limnocylindrales bacterium]
MPREYTIVLRKLSALSLLFLLLGGLAGALPSNVSTADAKGVAPLAPPQIDGVAVYVPFPVGIKVDGKTDDWAGVPIETVTKGPLISPDPTQNSSYSFQVAADASNFYVHMSAVTATIIAGKHKTDFWNEDSMEFFLNTSGDLSTGAYGANIEQVNVNAADIGNKNPDGLTITGVDAGHVHVHGFVFKTTDGWGFEVSVPMSDLGIVPTAAEEIGFQTQLNGASKTDRDAQLTWSKADPGNQSYQVPRVFGSAIFVDAGQTVAPTPGPRVVPTPTPSPAPPKPQVSVNQLGYYPAGEKLASYATSATTPQPWKLLDSTGKEVASGQTSDFGADNYSDDNVQEIDFSSFATAGTGYKLEVGGVSSVAFDISNALYGSLKQDALAYYYRDRSGIAIEAQYAGQQWVRAAAHLSDSNVTCYQGADAAGKVWPGCSYSLDASGGWYDAGDYGKYVVNGGISVWTLMDEYERNPKAWVDGSLNIPENKNGVPDILDEARWELKFLLGMQVPAGQPLAGMVHHKLHDDVWSAVPSMPPATTADRHLFPPSTAATLNVAAVGAQCARIWKTIDPAFSAQCLKASQAAWTAAQANPTMYAVAFTAGGGDYADTNVTDEFYWASAELYITTGDNQYGDFAQKSADWANAKIMDWGNTAALGTISLALIPNNLSADKRNAARQAIIATANSGVADIAKEGYRVPLTSYPWGSNSTALNTAMLMGLAYDFTSDRKYLDGVTQTMDYVLGRNTLNKSFVTGYGANPAQHPHHRFWANLPDQGYPAPPPGVLVGGANGIPGDPVVTAAGLTGDPLGKQYIDDIGSFSTNEVAINWNAPLAWITTFLDQEYKNPSLPTPSPAPASPTQSTSSGVSPMYFLVAVPGVLVLAALLFLLRRNRRKGSAAR